MFTCSTVMLCCLTSSPSALEKVDINAFVPEYVASIGDGTEPAKDPMLRIKPFLLNSSLEIDDGTAKGFYR